MYISYEIFYKRFLIKNEVSSKNLAHMIMEAEKSHSLLSARWRPSKTSGAYSSLTLKC
jgi:hypothetical protein